MPFQRNSGVSKIVIAAVIVVVVVVGSAVYALYLLNSQVPLLQVSGVSLNPNAISQSDNATLSFTIKNNDASSPHNIKVTFNVTSVTFYINGKPLDKDAYQVQYYNVQLQSSQSSTYQFGVRAVLTGGASTSTYQVNLNFYDENRTRFDTETQSLTVTS
jgi:hypothetical protein